MSSHTDSIDADWVDNVHYMKEAIALAAKGRGYTSPNPMVGALVVKDNHVIGRGWHRSAGSAHAEVEAINDAGDYAEGADIYVTLEPCNHYGKTPPCTKKIMESGIRRVFVAVKDPNPFVAGGGNQYLRDHGIIVKEGLCKDEAEALIEDFIWYMKNGKKPFVILKCAATLDGRIATSTGDSQWITCEKSRKFVHELRHSCDAILVGSGTLHKDNPSLTARIENFDGQIKDPRRVILDSSLSIDPCAKILTQSSNADTIIAASSHCDPKKRAILEDMGVTVLTVPQKKDFLEHKKYFKKIISSEQAGSSVQHNFLDFDNILEQLGKMGIMNILIEGGSTVIGSALSSGIVNKVLFLMEKKI
ncbi:MAG: bifunctional diaminohydroxyphosphoribosylaminopyrimidine deaminase/5-amino-6-(5-phosphoribosylamino)uracil reductase RibD, partial [Desulfamplus sp.]|nr:bifunctional diaminohydroxyphosphoribosylaminopyrimidine deaminase/5-amino-6-(5-phosphoribosylamino)uracil reductase RibD [Desulfamplus sp.]